MYRLSFAAKQSIDLRLGLQEGEQPLQHGVGDIITGAPLTAPNSFSLCSSDSVLESMKVNS